MTEKSKCPINRFQCLEPLHCYFIDEFNGKCAHKDVTNKLRMLGQRILADQQKSADGRLNG